MNETPPRRPSRISRWLRIAGICVAVYVLGYVGLRLAGEHPGPRRGASPSLLLYTGSFDFSGGSAIREPRPEPALRVAVRWVFFPLNETERAFHEFKR